jgi:hypothetical protein
MFHRTLLTLLLTPPILALTFPWEFSQLTPSEALSNPAYNFGPSTAPSPRQCKTMPGDADWPSAADWESFNTTLGGVLLKPRPLASVCYYGETYDARTCEQLKRNWVDKALQSFSPTPTLTAHVANSPQRRRPNKYHVAMGLGEFMHTHTLRKLDVHPGRLARVRGECDERPPRPARGEFRAE